MGMNDIGREMPNGIRQLSPWNPLLCPPVLFLGGAWGRQSTLASPLITTEQFVQHPEVTALPNAKRRMLIWSCRKIFLRVLSRLFHSFG